MFAWIGRRLARAEILTLAVVVGLALSLSWLTGRDDMEPASWKGQLPPATASLVSIVETLSPAALRNAQKIAVTFDATLDLWREISAR